MSHPTEPMYLEYVLPLKAPIEEDLDELTEYLRQISGWLDVTVVDGSDAAAYARNDARWSGFVRHVPPEPWPGRNGKVAGVVRWDRPSLQHGIALFRQADLVRPQNIFEPQPWHARWDTARSLVNRAFGADYPGTYLVRRSTFCRMGGYDGDVLFENLE